MVADTILDGGHNPATANRFLDTADYHLASEAYAKKYTLITREIISNSKGRIKIPNVCDRLRVPCASPHYMPRDQKAGFVLE